MNPVQPIELEILDRSLRFTFGARLRICQHFKAESIVDALNEHGEAALPFCLYACLFDEEGNPPSDLTVEGLAEQLPGDQAAELFAIFSSAVSQGQVSKKEAAAIAEQAQLQSIGSNSGPSPRNASGSPARSSGGGSRRRKSKRARSNGEPSSGMPTIEPV